MGRLHKAEVMIAGEQLRYGEKDEGKSVVRQVLCLLSVFTYYPSLGNMFAEDEVL